ncbi:MMPL family transporter [Sulfurospirillum multivorans]|uniref:Exporter n=2 Tax=Sulfurospirillum multivorans TaxID=66821 RepID=A0AA86DZB2_SULMK|nr:hypothetical protein [Sulfurospirillum multivorans]AHJ14168.1 putative exporter [Sulfurospirillum multivorans DSM 12446]QEH07653.1 putative exporter [Sulfurospirillum multivorans]
MKFWTKSLNIVLFSLVGTLFFVYQNSVHVSTNLLSFLPEGKSKEAFEIYSQFKNSKEVLIATEGFDKASLAKIKTIENKLLSSDLLTLESNITPNAKLIEYTKNNAFYLKNLNKNDSVGIPEKLKSLYETMTQNPYYTTIDASDPLGYFSPKEQKIPINIRDGHLALGDFGYLSVLSIKGTSNTIESYETIYNLVHQELQDMQNVRVFSPTFYFVENAQKIQDDVTFLIVLSTILLLVLYIFIIKNIYLLINTIATLATSALLSFLLIGMIWSEVSVFVLAFGNAIGTLAIDYMFHYYFYGHYENKKKFNTSVFYGFLTTFGGFLIFAWVDFPLIQQVCVFAMISLVLSYLQFVFLFPLIGFKKAQPYTKFYICIPLPYRAIALLSLLAIVLSVPFLKLDTNIKNLDYQNVSLMKEEKFFKDAIKKEGYMPLLLEADSIDGLIGHSNTIQKNFKNATAPLSYFFDKAFYEQRKQEIESLHVNEKKALIEEEATKLGFREGFFKNAYNEALLHPSYQELSLDTLREMGFDVVLHEGKYYTYALVKNSDRNLVSNFTFASCIDAKEMFFTALEKIAHQLLLGGIVAMAFIFFMLWMVCRKTIALSSSFVLLPTALILLFALMGTFTIAHIFMLFIMMLFGIDYGIYMSSEESFKDGTRSAIFFSIIDTFAGFGVLIFSDIGALHAMGLVSCVATAAILVLLMGRKPQ